MTQKIEIICDSIAGPHTLKIDDTLIEGIEDYELYLEDGVNKLKLVLITNNFQIKPKEQL